MTSGEKATKKDNWNEVIPNRDDIMLQGFELFDNYLALSERVNGLNTLRVINNSSGEDFYIDFGEETYTARLSANNETGTEVLRYSYSSLIPPWQSINRNVLWLLAISNNLS